MKDQATADLLCPDNVFGCKRLCVDTGYFDPVLSFADPFAVAPAIVFVGAMDYRPNVDAVAWFVAEIMPRLRSVTEAPSFWIVGSNPGAAVRQLAGPDVHVTGRVDDVRPYLAHAAAAVAPLRIARGIQNKVLEAMAMAAPVIVTPQARQGLDACGDGGMIEANSAEDFAAGHRMACQTFVHGDIEVSWIPLALRPPVKPKPIAVPPPAGEAA